MCGITGAIWWNARAAIDRSVLASMTRVLGHRGPDGEGLFHHAPDNSAVAGVALGHRRLAVIDPPGGHQPMDNEDQSVVVVLNGEIYNYPELRAELEAQGHAFRTDCDTEVVVHLYEEHGVACVERLNGMFALAIWDARRDQLVLARDRMGQKPLVYLPRPDQFLFASEIKSILQVPGVPRALDPEALDAFLNLQYVPYTQSIFHGFHKVRPGHTVVVRGGRVHDEAYWSVPPPSTGNWTRQAACEAIRTTLRDAVRLRLQSDVPLGAFLSGGVDSSLIVALMQQQTSRPVQTFSIGFPDPDYDESQHARRVAEALGTEHHEFHVTPRAVDILPKLVWHFDEPFADSSAVPTWYVSEQTRQHVTVSLTGDGGDELFGGYDRYRAALWAGHQDRLPESLRRILGAGFWQRLPQTSSQISWGRRIKRFSQAVNLPPGRRYLEWVGVFRPDQRETIYAPEFRKQLAEMQGPFVEQAWQAAGTTDPVAGASYTDLNTYLPCDLMKKVDMASMAHGLECRQPFLDFRLVELCQQLPSNWKTTHWAGKQILREACGDAIPDDVWQRRKQGFGIPIHRWFREDLSEMTHDLLLSPNARTAEYLDPSAVRNLFEAHLSGRFERGYHLWCLLVLESWMREWL